MGQGCLESIRRWGFSKVKGVIQLCKNLSLVVVEKSGIWEIACCTRINPTWEMHSIAAHRFISDCWYMACKLETSPTIFKENWIQVTLLLYVFSWVSIQYQPNGFGSIKAPCQRGVRNMISHPHKLLLVLGIFNHHPPLSINKRESTDGRLWMHNWLI